MPRAATAFQLSAGRIANAEFDLVCRGTTWHRSSHQPRLFWPSIAEEVIVPRSCQCGCLAWRAGPRPGSQECHPALIPHIRGLASTGVCVSRQRSLCAMHPLQRDPGARPAFLRQRPRPNGGRIDPCGCQPWPEPGDEHTQDQTPRPAPREALHGAPHCHRLRRRSSVAASTRLRRPCPQA